MSSTSPPPSPGPQPGVGSSLTPECQRVQTEITDLADALGVAALTHYPELKTSLLRAITEFRQRLREHVREIEGAGGLFDYIVGSDPAAGSRVDCLCQEHRELEDCLDELRRRLDGSVLTEPGAVEGIRRCAARLKTLVECHHQSGCKLIQEMAR